MKKNEACFYKPHSFEMLPRDDNRIRLDTNISIPPHPTQSSFAVGGRMNRIRVKSFETNPQAINMAVQKPPQPF